MSEDIFERPDPTMIELAMIAAPFAAAGMPQEKAIKKAWALHGEAWAYKQKQWVDKKLPEAKALTTWNIESLARQMGVRDRRSVWSHVEAVVGKKKRAQLQKEARGGAKVFPHQIWSAAIKHKIASVKNRNRTNARKRVSNAEKACR